ncbi:MAG: SDR family oxidoreductase [Kiritimatiellae bacterium]|nr:SDR family oxidoreductase [Kiritimatiellia bacterium]
MAECLVTGGAGFIGSNLSRALTEAGLSVRVLDNFSTGRRENLADLGADVDLVEGDIRDADAVAQAVRGVRYVFHLAALPSVIRSVGDPAATNDVNITGTLNALLAARDANVERFVFSSSSSVYGDTPTLPKQEDMTPMPLSPYAVSKLAGEHYSRIFHKLYGLKTFALRYFNVFGPRQDPASQYAAVIPLFIDALREGRAPTIYGDGEQTRDFTFVDDVVHGNLCCCTARDEAAGQVYNIAAGGRTSVNDLAAALARLMGKDVAPVHADPRPGDVRDSQAAHERAARLLGWSARVSFEEGLRQTVEWFTRA